MQESGSVGESKAQFSLAVAERSAPMIFSSQRRLSHSDYLNDYTYPLRTFIAPLIRLEYYPSGGYTRRRGTRVTIASRRKSFFHFSGERFLHHLSSFDESRQLSYPWNDRSHDESLLKSGWSFRIRIDRSLLDTAASERRIKNTTRILTKIVI